MAKVSRNVKQGLLLQGELEEISYSITTTPWGSSPSNATVQVIDRSNSDADVTTTVTATAVGDVITTPLIKSLTKEHLYRVYVQFKIGTKTLRAYFEIEAEL